MTMCISVVSQKGGVGKTTLSLNLAHALAVQGVRTLLVDVDPQGGIGLSLNSDGKLPGLKGYLEGESLGRCMLKTRVPGFAILPVGPLRGLDGSNMMQQLLDGTHLSALVEDADAFDVVLFDTPAGLTGSTLGALRASDHAFAALQAEPLSAMSLPQLLDVIGALRSEGAKVALTGIIVTMVQRGVESSLSVLESLWAKMPDALILDAHIPRDPVFLRASELGVPLALMSRRPPPIARRFDELASILASMIPVDDKEDEDAPLPLLM